MSIGVQVWSTVASSNATADTNINWAEGMAPSQVNDSARAEMASVAKFRDDNNGTLSTSGTTIAYKVTSNQVSTGNTDGYTLTVKFHATNDSSATLASDGNTAAPMQLVAGTNLSGGEFQTGSIQRFKYDSASTGWIAQGGGFVGASNLSTGAVTYGKIQLENTGSLIGNAQGISFPPQEIVIGSGLVLSTTSTSTAFTYTSTTTSTAIPYTLTAPAFPPTAAFKNLSIKVTGNSSATCAADYVTLATSGSSLFQTVAFPAAGINFATNGAVNALDTGSAASATWYAIYAIATAAATSVGFLASTSFTTPLMPSGYTYKARIGALVTSTSTASAQLMGTYQFGRQAQYVVGVAATANAVLMGSGAAGTYDATSPTLASLSTTGFVPSTATAITIVTNTTWKNGSSSILVAPNTSWGGTNRGPIGTVGMAWPINATNSAANYSFAVKMELEAAAIAWASSGSGGALCCVGWEDNL